MKEFSFNLFGFLKNWTLNSRTTRVQGDHMRKLKYRARGYCNVAFTEMKTTVKRK